MERDRLGRRRGPEQERGLRPLHPPLPEAWVSKALRVAMSEIRLGPIRIARGPFRGLAPSTGPGPMVMDLLELTRCIPATEPEPVDSSTTMGISLDTLTPLTEEVSR